MANIQKNTQTATFVKAKEFNKAIQNLNSLNFYDYDLNDTWFFIDLGDEFYIRKDEKGEYFFEFSGDKICKLNDKQTALIDDWISEKEKEYLYHEYYYRDIQETEEYLNVASRLW
ncbi:hypothetical protein GNY06_02960 [Elizabethkingia argentiflava]|uniref:Uncharacterized protein n=1 Tax=Elizabethkingia argenteiflava TaxID=2681556 RepID=A0A845PTL0_9FLAO|nr:hypothetical protein [Elizabethkingia argenteiflava]NAW50393.1 hypothetical protein [Elizabethkingia argenteiflava]